MSFEVISYAFLWKSAYGLLKPRIPQPRISLFFCQNRVSPYQGDTHMYIAIGWMVTRKSQLFWSLFGSNRRKGSTLCDHQMRNYSGAGFDGVASGVIREACRTRP